MKRYTWTFNGDAETFFDKIKKSVETHNQSPSYIGLIYKREVNNRFYLNIPGWRGPYPLFLYAKIYETPSGIEIKSSFKIPKFLVIRNLAFMLILPPLLYFLGYKDIKTNIAAFFISFSIIYSFYIICRLFKPHKKIIAFMNTVCRD